MGHFPHYPRECIIRAGSRMNHDEFDLFEIFRDGTALWRLTVTRREAAIEALHQLSTWTANEVRVMHLPSKTLIAAAMNTPADSRGKESTPGQG